MGVTKYLSIDGEILSERREGESQNRNYITDAMGSVIEVYMGTSLKADATYTAFGGDISASWRISEYRFQWVGSWGYRRTGKDWVNTYVRARHYSTSDGGWGSVDPLWPDEAAYRYVEGRVMGAVDPSGNSRKKSIRSAASKECSVSYCTIKTGKLFHSFTCVDGPNGGCSGELFPSIFGGHQYNAYGKPQVKCREIEGAKCEIKSRGDCYYAARVCQELKKPKNDYHYWGEGMCHFYAVGVLCDACEAYKYGGKSHERCVCEHCGQVDSGGARLGMSRSGDWYLCGRSDPTRSQVYDPSIARPL